MFLIFVDFQRILLSYGVVRNLKGPRPFEWDIFRGLADLVQKSDDAMEEYLKKVIRMAEEVVYLHEGGPIKKLVKEDDGNTPQLSELGAPDDSETLSYDRAKKIVKRIEAFYKLREVVIHDSHVILYLTF